MRRFLYTEEKVRRGCVYCADAIRVKVKTGDVGGQSKTLYVEATKFCPFPKCPYRELDKCKSFHSYLKMMEKKYGTVAQMLDVRKK